MKKRKYYYCEVCKIRIPKFERIPRCRLCKLKYQRIDTYTEADMAYEQEMARQFEQELQLLKSTYPHTPELIGYDESYFYDLNFYNEREFSDWFRNNYHLYNLKEILKIDNFFPDVIARTNDNAILHIELEFHARNFRTHKHDNTFCDLIISYLSSPRSLVVNHIPVIPMFYVKRFTTNTSYSDITLSDYFAQRIDL